MAVDGDDSQALAHQAQGRVLQQVTHGVRRRSVAVGEFSGDIGQRFLVLDSGDTLVHAQALIFFRDVVRRNADVESKVELSLGFFRFDLALEFAHGALEHRRVHLEADGIDVSALLAA